VSQFRQFVVRDPTKGVLTDTSRHKLGPGMWAEARNVRFHNGRVLKVPGWESQGQTATGTPSLICRARFSTGDDFPIVCTDRFIYKVHTDDTLTQLNAADFTTSAHARWEMDSFPDAVFFNRTDGNKKIQKFNGLNLRDLDDAAWGTFYYSSGYTAPPRGKHIAQYSSHLMVGAITNDGAGNIDLQTVGSSDIADGFDPQGEFDWDFAADASESVFMDVFEGNDEVMRVLRIGDYLAVYKENSIHLLAYSGGTYTYIKQQPIAYMGTPCPSSVIGVKGIHYFVGQENIYRFNGAELTPIGSGVYAYFLASVMPDDRRDLWAFDDVIRKEIVWGGNGDVALVYNYENGAFSFKEWPFVAAGYVNLTLPDEDWVPGGIYDTPGWRTDPGPPLVVSDWENMPWRRQTALNDLTILGAKSDGTLWKLHAGEVQAGTTDIDAWFDSPDHDYGDPSAIKMVNEMRLEGTVSGVNPMEVWVGTRDHLGEAFDFGLTPYRVSENRVTFAKSARWFRYRFAKRGGDFSLERYVTHWRTRGRF